MWPSWALLKFEVRFNELLCLLDSGATHLFVSSSVIARLGWVATKVAKPIKIQLAQKATTLTNKVVFGAILECGKTKLAKNFTVYALDGIETILRNPFLDVYHVDILKGGLKLKVITRIVDRSINLKVKYHVSLAKVGIHLVSLQEL